MENKTKEEILSKNSDIPVYRMGDDRGEYILKSVALKSMQEFADQEKQREAIEFLKWTSDLNKCDYYPIYDGDTSCIGWCNRNNDNDTKTEEELYQIFKSKP